MHARVLLICGLLGLGLLGPVASQGAITCDGLDDEVASSVSMATFLTPSTGTLTLWLQPTGLATSWETECHAGADILVSDEVNRFLGLHRHPNLEGTGDRLCAANWDGGWTVVSVPYTVNAWVHLAWVHGSGNLCLYSNGVLAGCTPSSDTTELTRQLVLCGGDNYGEVLDGVIAAVRVYPLALTADELRVQAGSRLVEGGWSQPSGAWTFDTCVPSGSADGLSFPDRSGNGNALLANNGPNDAGMGCLGTTHISPGWGVE